MAPRVSLGDDSLAIGNVLAVAGADVVVLVLQSLTGSSPVIAPGHDPAVSHPSEMTLALELVGTVVLDDCPTGHGVRPHLPQQGGNVFSKPRRHNMLSPRVVSGHAVAQHLKQVGPHASTPLYSNPAGEDGCSFVVPVFGLNFSLLAEGQPFLEKSTTRTTWPSSSVAFRSLKAIRWDLLPPVFHEADECVVLISQRSRSPFHSSQRQRTHAQTKRITRVSDVNDNVWVI